MLIFSEKGGLYEHICCVWLRQEDAGTGRLLEKGVLVGYYCGAARMAWCGFLGRSPYDLGDGVSIGLDGWLANFFISLQRDWCSAEEYTCIFLSSHESAPHPNYFSDTTNTGEVSGRFPDRKV